jgi:type II secretion system protein I
VTLVELLAALALLAVVAVTLSEAWTLGIRVAGRSRAEVTAAALAENKLAEIVAAEASPSSAVSGDFGEEHRGYRWRCQWREWPTDSRLRQIDVTVTWTRRNTSHETTVSTLVDTAQE